MYSIPYFMAFILILCSMSCKARENQDNSSAKALNFANNGYLYRLSLETSKGEKATFTNLQDYEKVVIILWRCDMDQKFRPLPETCVRKGQRMGYQYRNILQRGDVSDKYDEIRDYILRKKITDNDLVAIGKAIGNEEEQLLLKVTTDAEGKIVVNDSEAHLLFYAILPFISLKESAMHIATDVTGRYGSKHREDLALKAANADRSKDEKYKSYIFKEVLPSIFVIRVYFVSQDGKDTVYYNYWKNTGDVTGPYDFLVAK